MAAHTDIFMVATVVIIPSRVSAAADESAECITRAINVVQPDGSCSPYISIESAIFGTKRTADNRRLAISETVVANSTPHCIVQHFDPAAERLTIAKPCVAFGKARRLAARQCVK